VESMSVKAADVVAQPFPVGGPTSSSWREVALTRIAEQHTLAIWLQRRRQEEKLEPIPELFDTIVHHLDTARQAAGGITQPPRGTRLLSAISGSDVERVMTHVDAADADILRLAPPSYLRGLMPSILAHVRAHLEPGDPRRVRLEEISREAARNPLDALDQDVIVSVMRAASSAGRREIARVRSFRNVLSVTAFVLTLIVVALVTLAAAYPEAIPMCFHPGGAIVCPTRAVPAPDGPASYQLVRATASSWDLPLIAIVGAISAAVAGAAALRNVRGTSTPYSLPVALAILKLPTGALTAVLGILLMRGQFVPGLSALDFPAQIIAWAIVFGYAQQLLTRLVDQQAHNVLDDVGGSGGATSKAAPG
jgi:hypothetical protein